MPLLPTPPDAIRTKSLAKGEALFHQGDVTFALFAVRRGRVRLVRHLADGDAVTLYVAEDGDSFAEASLFSPVYHCDAIADVASEIDVHPKDALLTALEESPEASRAFMAHLARHVIALRARLELRNIRSAKDRVLHFLKLEAPDDDCAVTFARPLKDVAREIGLSHESFYRTLADLQADGLINRQGRTVTLCSHV